MKALALLLLLLLPACGLLPASMTYQGMDPKAIHEAVKDKNSAATCSRIMVAGQTGEFLVLNNDAGVIKGGSATIKCGNLGEATFTNQPTK